MCFWYQTSFIILLTDQKEPHSGPERVFSPVYEVRPGATECGSARLDSNSPLLTSPYFTPIPPCCLLPLSSPHTLSPLYPSPPPPTPTSYQTHSSYLTEMVVTYPTLQFHSLTPLIFSLFFLDSPQHLPLVFSHVSLKQMSSSATVGDPLQKTNRPSGPLQRTAEETDQQSSMCFYGKNNSPLLPRSPGETQIGDHLPVITSRNPGKAGATVGAY